MKKYYILNFVFLFSFNYINSQIVETLVTHPKIKDGMYVDEDGNIYTTSGGLQNGKEIGKYNITTDLFEYNYKAGFFGPIDIDKKSNGDYIVTNFDNNTVSVIDFNTNEITIIASGLDGPAGIAIDKNDNIYISNFGAPDLYEGHQIHKISPDGIVSVLADSPLLFRFQAMVFNGNEELIVSSQNKLYKVDTETGVLEEWVTLGNFGFGHMIFRSYDSCIYGTATGESKIYKVDEYGVVSIYVGSVPGYMDGELSGALFNKPLGIEISPDENTLYIGDSNRLRKITMDINSSIVNTDLNKLIIYPNPTSNGMINILNDKGIVLEIELYDNIGNRLVEKVAHDCNIFIDINTIVHGVYFLKIQHKEQFIIEEIIKY